MDNAIFTFGKVIFWKKDYSKIARLIFKARVLDLESVPQHIFLYDAEDFKGEYWTIQCEIIQDELLDVSDPGPRMHMVYIF